MARLKRLNAPKWWPIERKQGKFVIKPRGPHSMAIPLQVVIRDVLKLAETAKEAKTIINRGDVLVDGTKRKDIKYGIGPMDIIGIPLLKKSWRAIPKNGLTFVETEGSDAKLKICRIMDKKILKGKKIQLNLSDGKNILTETDYSTKDSLLIEIPSQKIIDVFKFKKGNIVLVTGGKNEGLVSKIDEIDEKNKRIWLKKEKQKTEVPIKLVTVVGKDESAIKLK